MHPGQDRHARVDVVVDLDPPLAVDWTEHAPNVLDQASPECDREREEERVERRAIEALAEQAAGREEDDPIPGSSGREAVGDETSRLLPHPALEDIWHQAHHLELRREACQVLGPLRQDQTVAADARCRSDVSADLSRAGLVLHEVPEDRLD